MAGARFVVSESGDILSPKYAPDTTAPAVMTVGKPNAVPTPIRATPMDPAVDQDEPVARDTMEQRIQAVTKKILGLITLIPKYIMEGMVPAAIQDAIIQPTIARIRQACIDLLIDARMPCSR